MLSNLSITSKGEENGAKAKNVTTADTFPFGDSPSFNRDTY